MQADHDLNMEGIMLLLHNTNLHECNLLPHRGENIFNLTQLNSICFLHFIWSALQNTLSGSCPF